jgi:manganese transport protein
LNIVELFLGIMTAIGGFVDVSELVFAAQAGSRFGYALIFVFAFSTIGIMVFGEMSGRVAAIAKQPVFNLMRHRLSLQLGLITLIASLISNLITCAAELGGVAIILHLLTGFPYWLMAILATLAITASVWVLPFKWIERSYGLLGLFMLVFPAALIAIHPPWSAIAHGFVPRIPPGMTTTQLLSYAYFAVAIVSAVMFPYETYFYSSGAIEDKWTRKDLGINRLTSVVGFGLGSLLAIGILASSAQLFGPLSIDPQMPGSAAMEAQLPFAARHALRYFWRGGRDLHVKCLQPGSVFWMGVGALQKALGRAPIYAQLARCLYIGAWHRSEWRRSDEACRICGDVLDPRTAPYLPAAPVTRR